MCALLCNGCMRYVGQEARPGEILSHRSVSWVKVRTTAGREIALRDPRMENDSLVGTIIEKTDGNVVAGQRVALHPDEITTFWIRQQDPYLTIAAIGGVVSLYVLCVYTCFD